MPIDLGGQIVWVEIADEGEVPKSDETNLVLDFPDAHLRPSKAEIQKNLLMENQDKSGLVQLTKTNLRKKAKNKVEKAVNSQNSAKPSKSEEVDSEVQKIPSQVFENQGFVQLTKKKAEMDETAEKAKKAEIKTFNEDPFGKWEKLEDTDIFEIPTGPIKLLTLTPNSFGPKCSKKRNVKRQAGL